MKTKTLIAVLLVAVVLVSCAPAATSVPPTKTAVPTVTVTVPTPTKAPTQIPATPTEAGLSKEDYLAKSENIFPTPEVDGLAEFSCLADFDNIIYQHHTLPDGTVVKAWLSCEDGGVQFLVPLFIENDQMSYMTLSIKVTNKLDDPVKSEYGDAAVKRGVEGLAKALGLAGKTRVKVLIGMNSASILSSNDPFPAIFTATDIDEAMEDFGATGNPNSLKTIPGLPGKVLLGIRIKLATAN